MVDVGNAKGIIIVYLFKALKITTYFVRWTVWQLLEVVNRRDELEEILWGHLSSEIAPEVAKYQVQHQKRAPNAKPISTSEMASVLSAAVKDKPASQVCHVYFGIIV